MLPNFLPPKLQSKSCLIQWQFLTLFPNKFLSLENKYVTNNEILFEYWVKTQCFETWFINIYLHQAGGEYVFGMVCLSVCLFICLPVSKIALNLIKSYRFPWNLGTGCSMGQGRTHSISEQKFITLSLTYIVFGLWCKSALSNATHLNVQ